MWPALYGPRRLPEPAPPARKQATLAPPETPTQDEEEKSAGTFRERCFRVKAASPTRANLAGPTPGLAIAGQPVRPTSAPPSLGGDSAGGLASGAGILEVLARHEADIRRHARKPLTLGRLESGHRLLTSPHAGQARSRRGSTTAP